jgi:hypothetical protein
MLVHSPLTSITVTARVVSIALALAIMCPVSIPLGHGPIVLNVVSIAATMMLGHLMTLASL